MAQRVKSLTMPNCSIEAKQKVVSLYHKGYSLFSISKATSVPKGTCWDIVRRYNSRRHVKNRKGPGRPKNLDSKEEKQLINLSQNDPKKIQLNLYGILIRKKNCSTSLIRTKWFSEKELEIFENWPPNSPDINIIENVWSLLKKRVFERRPKNIEELWAFCQEEFERIPLEYIQNLYSSIPDRLNKIVQCNGKNIKF